MTEEKVKNNNKANPVRIIFRCLLGAFLMFAGTSHLTWSRTEFLAQVPTWLPLDGDIVVILSGIVEIVLGASLILLHGKRFYTGWAAAVFFILIFPGNISQYVNGINAFGLDTDTARLVRLFFQPLLVIWALWSTGAWKEYRKRKLS